MPPVGKELPVLPASHKSETESKVSIQSPISPAAGSTLDLTTAPPALIANRPHWQPQSAAQPLQWPWYQTAIGHSQPPQLAQVSQFIPANGDAHHAVQNWNYHMPTIALAQPSAPVVSSAAPHAIWPFSQNPLISGAVGSFVRSGANLNGAGVLQVNYNVPGASGTRVEVTLDLRGPIDAAEQRRLMLDVERKVAALVVQHNAHFFPTTP